MKRRKKREPKLFPPKSWKVQTYRLGDIVRHRTFPIYGRIIDEKPGYVVVDNVHPYIGHSGPGCAGRFPNIANPTEFLKLEWRAK